MAIDDRSLLIVTGISCSSKEISRSCLSICADAVIEQFNNNAATIVWIIFVFLIMIIELGLKWEEPLGSSH